MSDNERVMKSYVWHGDRCFFVSTIERDSSALIIPSPRYNETIVWAYDWEKAERGEMIAQHEAPLRSIGAHIAICSQLYRHGYIPDESDGSVQNPTSPRLSSEAGEV